MNVSHYIEQHKSIKNEIIQLKELRKKNQIVEDATELAYHISALAGKIKIHLLSEDKYLYPNLQRNSDERIRKMAQNYQDEMGPLANHYIEFKEMYNTPNKIQTNQDSFKKDLDQTLSQIEKRMDKEEKELYQMLL